MVYTGLLCTGVELSSVVRVGVLPCGVELADIEVFSSSVELECVVDIKVLSTGEERLVGNGALSSGVELTSVEYIEV